MQNDVFQNAPGSAPEDALFPPKLGAVWRAHVEGAQGSMVGLKEGVPMHVPLPRSSSTSHQHQIALLETVSTAQLPALAACL